MGIFVPLCSLNIGRRTFGGLQHVLLRSDGPYGWLGEGYRTVKEACMRLPSSRVNTEEKKDNGDNEAKED